MYVSHEMLSFQFSLLHTFDMSMVIVCHMMAARLTSYPYMGTMNNLWKKNTQTCTALTGYAHLSYVYGGIGLRFCSHCANQGEKHLENYRVPDATSWVYIERHPIYFIFYVY